jgi:hypothetical protein
MTNKVVELFSHGTRGDAAPDWAEVVRQQQCPFLNRKCIKTRKSEPNVAIGTCTLEYGVDSKAVIICPHRLLERKQIFMDCLHLLTNHEPGNELHVVPERSIPGGSIDYFLVSAKNRKVRDFVGIELQTLDTTGTIWPERQRFLREHGIRVKKADTESTKSFGMNWKMTAKTILVQLHHKIETFENINKHLVLVAQDHLFDYMRREFSFSHLSEPARLGDSMQFHIYGLANTATGLRLELRSRLSTDQAGIATCLGLQAIAKVDLQEIINALEPTLSDATLLTFGE